MRIRDFTFWLKKPRSFRLGFGGACTLLESRIYAVPCPHRDAPRPAKAGTSTKTAQIRDRDEEVDSPSFLVISVKQCNQWFGWFFGFVISDGFSVKLQRNGAVDTKTGPTHWIAPFFKGIRLTGYAHFPDSET